MYENFFKEAISRTRKLGLSLPAIKLRKGQRYTVQEFVNGGLQQLVYDTFGPLAPSEIAAGCVRMHANLLKPIESALGCKAYLTIGSVFESDHSYYDLSDQKIGDILFNGITSTFPFHCWITLDTLEIIDVSFATSYGVVNGQEQDIGRCLALHPSSMKDSGIKLIYKPMLVGEAFLKTVGFDLTSGAAIGFTSSYRSASWFHRNITCNLLSIFDKT